MEAVAKKSVKWNGIPLKPVEKGKIDAVGWDCELRGYNLLVLFDGRWISVSEGIRNKRWGRQYHGTFTTKTTFGDAGLTRFCAGFCPEGERSSLFLKEVDFAKDRKPFEFMMLAKKFIERKHDVDLGNIPEEIAILHRFPPPKANEEERVFYLIKRSQNVAGIPMIGEVVVAVAKPENVVKRLNVHEAESALNRFVRQKAVQEVLAEAAGSKNEAFKSMYKRYI